MTEPAPTDSPIRAIPTSYHGCIFRSRTEARWAVFFDAVGLRWEYEPEGFKLPNGTWYLPDFWLPEMEYWVEVKSDKGPTKDETDKAEFLALGTGYPCIMLSGAPWHRSFPVLWPHEHGGERRVDEIYCHFSDDYTVERADGMPRLFTCDGGEIHEGWDKRVEQAARIARSIDLTDPDADAVLPAGWEGIGIPF